MDKIGHASVHLVEIPREEALKLMAGQQLGRVVFSQSALPAIRPVTHMLDQNQIIIRTHDGSALLGAANTGTVVAYEADQIDPETRTGWSVIATGTASKVSDPDLLERYRRLLQPWVTDGEMEHVIQIKPELVTGYRLVSGVEETPGSSPPAATGQSGPL